MDPDLEVADFWIDAAFFLEKTTKRRTALTAIRKALGLPAQPARERFSLTRDFGTPEGPYMLVRISESRFADDPPPSEEPPPYYVSLHIHGNESSHPHTAPADGREVGWAFERILKLCTDEKNLMMFFDAEMTVRTAKIPGSVVSAPLSLGAKVMPVVGVEYATDIGGDGVNRFRWVQREPGIVANVSYVSAYQPSQLADIWVRERDIVINYVREAVSQ